MRIVSLKLHTDLPGDSELSKLINSVKCYALQI